jgi:hypothetical protein
MLLRVVDQLCAELGGTAVREDDLDSPLNRDGMSGLLTPEEESLVARLRRGLAKVAAAVSAKEPDDGPKAAVRAALDGAEMVMRGELASGNAEQLPSLMPSFVFMVTLPAVDQDGALDLSRRTAELIERELRC